MTHEDTSAMPTDMQPTSPTPGSSLSMTKIVANRWTLRRDGGGNPLTTLETNNDITQRKRAEELLRKCPAQYFDEAQQLSRTGRFGWNFSCGEVFWSERIFSIFE
jgi:hypothetical protein